MFDGLIDGCVCIAQAGVLAQHANPHLVGARRIESLGEGAPGDAFAILLLCVHALVQFEERKNLAVESAVAHGVRNGVDAGAIVH